VVEVWLGWSGHRAHNSEYVDGQIVCGKKRWSRQRRCRPYRSRKNVTVFPLKCRRWFESKGGDRPVVERRLNTIRGSCSPDQCAGNSGYDRRSLLGSLCKDQGKDDCFGQRQQIRIGRITEFLTIFPSIATIEMWHPYGNHFGYSERISIGFQKLKCSEFTNARQISVPVARDRTTRFSGELTYLDSSASTTCTWTTQASEEKQRQKSIINMVRGTGVTVSQLSDSPPMLISF